MLYLDIYDGLDRRKTGHGETLGSRLFHRERNDSNTYYLDNKQEQRALVKQASKMRSYMSYIYNRKNPIYKHTHRSYSSVVRGITVFPVYLPHKEDKA